ncbi:hypothetical protein BC937DRAFT_87107 [Endogone sp. FLAS-F59071]|nr:hypothetical protein BC937DRAFT_87107 [Endogone sp. FLAS-F59071]|eukprot:RUS12751.1 hypothetical protein BC937DRAFT_87107 [Endogone sp. FLAS-F59071]
MCIWANHDFARLATRKPLHLEAVKLTRYMYDTYDLERYSLRKTAGVAKFDIVKL